jgi:hypothetical protein
LGAPGPPCGTAGDGRESVGTPATTGGIRVVPLGCATTSSAATAKTAADERTEATRVLSLISSFRLYLNSG